MSDQNKTLGEVRSPDSNHNRARSAARVARKEGAGRKKPSAVAEGPSCPFCGKPWDDHNLVRIRECMPKLEEALRLAERARIRASLK